MIDDQYKNALVLIKNDRIGLENVLKTAALKWHCQSQNDYEKKVTMLGEKHKWDFDRIVVNLHKTHYNIIKSCERFRDNNNDKLQWKGRNINSPSWRSNITV